MHTASAVKRLRMWLRRLGGVVVTDAEAPVGGAFSDGVIAGAGIFNCGSGGGQFGPDKSIAPAIESGTILILAWENGPGLFEFSIFFGAIAQRQPTS